MELQECGGKGEMVSKLKLTCNFTSKPVFQRQETKVRFLHQPTVLVPRAVPLPYPVFRLKGYFENMHPYWQPPLRRCSHLLYQNSARNPSNCSITTRHGLELQPCTTARSHCRAFIIPASTNRPEMGPSSYSPV